MFALIAYDLNSNRYHPITFRMAPMPGNKDLGRFKSAGHHTDGFESMDAAIEFFNDPKGLIGTDGVIKTHVLPVEDVLTQDMSMVVFSNWDHQKPIEAEKVFSLGGDLGLVKLENLPALTEAPAVLAAVAYDETDRSYVPMVFLLAASSINNLDTRKYMLYLSSNYRLESFEAAKEKITSDFENFDGNTLLSTHALTVKRKSMIDGMSLDIAGFRKGAPVSIDNIKAVNLSRGQQGQFTLPPA